MAAVLDAFPARRRRAVLPGFGLTMGFTLIYLSALVLVPLAALVLKTSTLGLSQFWDTVTAPRVLASYKITFLIALLWSGIGFMLRGGISMSPALGLPRSVFYASIPTGAMLALLAVAGRMMRRREPHQAVTQDAAVAHD